MMLTNWLYWINLALLTHSAIWCSSQKNIGDNTPLLSVVFFCPSKSNTGLFCIKSIMVECVKGLRLAIPIYRTANLILSASNNLAVVLGGLKSNIGLIAMHTYTQNQPNTRTFTPNVRLNSLFTLLDANRLIIADKLTFQQVKPLAEHIKGSIVKFQKMEALS